MSWSNENDIVFDPMCGSGTTCKMSLINRRNYIGVDISEGDGSSFGGTFRGLMDENSLIDDNSMTDHNGDGVISDADVFGEHLYWVLNCDKEDDARDPKCSSLLANNGENPPIKDLEAKARAGAVNKSYKAFFDVVRNEAELFMLLDKYEKRKCAKNR